MLRLLMNFLIVVAWSGVAFAQDLETIPVQDLRDGKVILMGRLGVPVGIPVEAKYMLTDENIDRDLKRINRKWEETRARVLFVNGKRHEPFIEFVNVYETDKIVTSIGETSSLVYEALFIDGTPNQYPKPEVTVSGFRFEPYSVLWLNPPAGKGQYAQPKEMPLATRTVAVSSVMEGKTKIVGDLGVPMGTIVSVSGTIHLTDEDDSSIYVRFEADQIESKPRKVAFLSTNSLQISRKKVIEGYRGTFLAYECFSSAFNEKTLKPENNTTLVLIREE